jgi:hypothetical protein
MACHRSQSSWRPSQKSARIPRTRSRRSAVSGETARRPRIISFRRGKETPSFVANSNCVRPRGFRNSSNSISPGGVGGRCVGSRMSAVRSFSPLGLVIVCDLDFVGIARLPPKTHPVLGVDPNAVLVAPGTTESLQPIARGTARSRKSRTRLIWSSFRRAMSHNALGQARSALADASPLKMSLVAASQNDLITDNIMQAARVESRGQRRQRRKRTEQRSLYPRFITGPDYVGRRSQTLEAVQR